MTAAIYARQSVEKADSVSIESQVESCAAVCRARGWTYRVYTDAGFSGKDLRRPGFGRLLRDIDSGDTGAVVAYRLDRISRSIADFAGLLQHFEDRGVSFVSVTEQFDTASPAGRAMIYIVMVFAQLERETITQRVTDNYHFRAVKGLYMGGAVPLGYRVESISIGGKRAAVLRRDDASAETVRRIYAMYRGGDGTQAIAKALNASAETAGRCFSAASVARILRNMTYCSASPEIYGYLKRKGYAIESDISAFDASKGLCCCFKSRGRHTPTAVSDRVVVVGPHEPVIEAGDWLAVQERLDGARTFSRQRSSRRTWLAGLVRCGCCGGRMTVRSSRKGNTLYIYFRCPAESCSGRPWISARELEQAVSVPLLRRAGEAVAASETGKPAGDVRLRELRREQARRQAEIQNLIAGIGSGGAVIDRYLRQHVEELDRQCRETAAEIGRMSQTAAPDTEKAASGLVEAAFYSADERPKSLLARALIREITIRTDGTAAIRWLA